MDELEIKKEQLYGTKGASKRIIKQNIYAYFKEMITEQGKGKSKIHHLLEGLQNNWNLP